MKRHGVAVCGVQEHRRVHAEDKKEGIDIKMVEDYQLITASVWRNEAKAATGGVGLMLSKEAQRTLISVTRTSDHVIIASFKTTQTSPLWWPTLQHFKQRARRRRGSTVTSDKQ